ncbi:MAG: hypothetical protein JWL95_1231 [Gemmatimonadetes bacterium]|nr:hypothetical protein [Gemmatimonadota bacterium]
MRRVLAVLLLPVAVEAQEVVLRDGGPRLVASIVSNAITQPHALRVGRENLVLRRDTLVTSNLLVLGRPTYLASRVQGDVVVVGADLYLRPGADITGRAIAIGGTVSRSFLGSVGGTTESYRDDSYTISGSGGRYELAYQGRAKSDAPPTFQLAGIQGLMMPAYDRVDGLSLPVGALVTLGERVVEVQPFVTYRSRLGAFDPGVALRVMPDRPVRLEADIARSTRTNDAWSRGDLVNSALTIGVGNDSRNYFRADGGTARLIGHVETVSTEIEPFVGGRYERVSPITAAGNVFSFAGRTSIEHAARPNPLVERGTIGSVLAGVRLAYSAGPVRAKLAAEGERSLETPNGTSDFTQLTLHGAIDFPTFGLQRLLIEAHCVASAGDSVPRSRYAYLGGGGTVPLMEQLEQGGDRLLFVDSKYAIPISAIVLPLVGSPTIFFRHIMGAAGVRSLPKLEQEIGAGIGIKMVRFDVMVDAAGKRDPKFGVGLSTSN